MVVECPMRCTIHVFVAFANAIQGVFVIAGCKTCKTFLCFVEFGRYLHCSGGNMELTVVFFHDSSIVCISVTFGFERISFQVSAVERLGFSGRIALQCSSLCNNCKFLEMAAQLESKIGDISISQSMRR